MDKDAGPYISITLQEQHWEFVRSILLGDIKPSDGAEIVAEEILEQLFTKNAKGE